MDQPIDLAADLQAQIVALRNAVEGVWLSVLLSGPDAVANAERLRTENVDALKALSAHTPEAQAMRNQVIVHTDQLWKSIVWQLGAEPADQPNAG